MTQYNRRGDEVFADARCADNDVNGTREAMLAMVKDGISSDIEVIDRASLVVLTSRECHLIFSHYYEGFSLTELAQLHGLSRTGVDAIMNRAYEKLRHRIDCIEGNRTFARHALRSWPKRGPSHRCAS
jgi:DNA-directed RNA polymerase specialized sigma24 family protein